MKSKTVTIKIKCDNDAFVYPNQGDRYMFEINRILNMVIDNFEFNGFHNQYLLDINGNECGTVKVTGF